MPADQVKQKSGQGRKFPFRPRTRLDRKAIADKVNAILISIDPMIYHTVRVLCKCGWPCEDDIQEIAQLVRVHLWRESLPKFNAWKGAKVSTYLHRCIRNSAVDHFRAFIRNNPRQGNCGAMWSGAAPDVLLDHQVYAVAADLLSDPSGYLTERQAETLTAYIESQGEDPKMSMKGLAERLGYARTSSLSTMIRRIKDSIMSIDIEEVDIHEAGGS